MYELTKWNEPARPSREVRQIKQDTAYTGQLIDAEAAIAGRIMERVKDVDSYRLDLAGGNDVLNMALMDIEANFINRVKQIQRRW